MAFQAMTATDAVQVIQSLEFIADGGSKKLTDSVGNYAQTLSDKKAVTVAVIIKESFSEELGEQYMRQRGLISDPPISE